MKSQLVLTYDQETDQCTVGGIPCTGDGVVMRGLCYAILERAKDVIRTFDPKRAASPIVLAQPNGRIPGLKG